MLAPSVGRNALIILTAESAQAAMTVLKQIEHLGGRIVHVYPPRILVGEVPPEIEPQVRALANVRALHRRRLELADAEVCGPEAVRVVKAWNRGFAASLRALKSGRASEGKSWGAPGYSLEGPVQPPRGAPGGAGASSRATVHDRSATGQDSSAYLIGKVAVNIILVEGKAPPYTFSSLERDTVVAEIHDGLGWLGSVEPRAAVSWVYEVRQVSLDLDPALTPDFSEDTWRDAAMAKLGYPASWDGLEQFVRDRRAALGTDWSLAVFVTRFPLWHFAYAYKPRVVMNYDLNGWGIDDMDRVVAHETGHIFGAADEYAESKCDCQELCGYLQIANGNCELGAAGQVQCIMSHNTWAICDYTRGHLGWRDSNGDGVFDPLDPAPARRQVWWLPWLDALRRWLGLTGRV